MELPNIDEVRKRTKKVQEDTERFEERCRREKEMWLKKATKEEEDRIVAVILKNIGEMITCASEIGRDYCRLSENYGLSAGYDHPDMPNPNREAIAEIVHQKISTFGYSFRYCSTVKSYLCSW